MHIETTSRSYDAVQLPEMKEFLREDRSIEDPLIESLIRTAEKVITDNTGYYISLASFVMHLEGFSDLKVPYKPLQKDSIAITYFDENGNEQPLPESGYDINFGEITFLSDLPELDESRKYPVRVAFQCGRTPENIDEDLKTAIKLLVLIYHRRELPENERANINPLKIEVLRQLIIDKKISHFK